jgi:hypothetical protein
MRKAAGGEAEHSPPSDAEINNKKLNSVALVRKQTILAELPPLVGEVSANL